MLGKTMGWDGNKANTYFLDLKDKHNPDNFKSKPEDSFHLDLHDSELAFKYIYAHCARFAWTREMLIAFLQDAITNSTNGKVFCSMANDEKKYIEVYRKEAKRILDEVLQGRLSF